MRECSPVVVGSVSDIAQGEMSVKTCAVDVVIFIPIGIDFEYAHGVGFFQGQEPEDSSYKYDEAFYREKGYEPPKNKRNMKRD